MAQISAEELRIRVAISNPNMSSADVRREADRVITTLEAIEAEDNLRAVLAAQVAEQDAQQAAEAKRRDEAFNDARSIVARSNPGWSADSIEREAHKLAAENEAAVAALNLRDALADGFDKSPALRVPEDARPVGGW